MAARWVHNTRAGSIRVFEKSFIYKNYHKPIFLGSDITIYDLPPQFILEIGDILEAAYDKGQQDKYQKPEPKGIVGFIKKLIGK